MLVNNAGFNCLAARVVVTHAGWSAARRLPRRADPVPVARSPPAAPTTPAPPARRDAFLAAHPEARVATARGPPDALPWTVIPSVPPGRIDDICFNVESFFGRGGRDRARPAPSAAAFVDAATEFANDVLWGTLSATILVSPSTMKEPVGGRGGRSRPWTACATAPSASTLWHALAFAIGTTTWGAYPGHPRTDIQSGTGVVGNAAMFDRPQKSVVRGPFRSRPKPPWFATAAGSYDVMRRFVAFEAAPSVGQGPGAARRRVAGLTLTARSCANLRTRSHLRRARHRRCTGDIVLRHLTVVRPSHRS